MMRGTAHRLLIRFAVPLPMMTINSQKPHGFTLVEMAIVLVLMGIVMTMGLKMVSSTLENAAYSETKSKQERIKLALIGFLRTNGRLPCPDNVAGVPSGDEAAACYLNAGDAYGIVPWRTLGIPRDTVLDGWGNYFTYSVSNGTAVSKNWTSRTLGTPFSINELAKPSDALIIQELNAAGTALNETSKKAVVAILSHGKNGFGAKTAKVSDRMPVADAGAGEVTNASPLTTTFVLRPVTEAPTAFNGPYDDLLAYLTPQDLLQPLVTEGTLKACVAYCASAAVSSCASGVVGEICTCPNGSGVAGVPGPCSGACSTCQVPVVSLPCATTSSVPIGLNPAICLP